MKIYTKTGDNGETGLFAGPRVRKDHPRIEAYGAIDELNAVLGLIRAESLPSGMDRLIERLQNELFAVGAALATPDPAEHGTDLITLQHVVQLEAEIDQAEERLPQLQHFILPGDARPAALLHLARTICRRAERRVCSLQSAAAETVDNVILIYINRLSDLLFLLARSVNAAAGRGETAWRSIVDRQDDSSSVNPPENV